MDELVSIIMPCHNGEKYIKEAIKSVISQTYWNWELLIVDDNSTDNSVKIIQSFSMEEPRIRLLFNNINTGYPSTPRNIALKEARGEIIAFLDCDDIWLSSKLEKQIPIFKNCKCAVVFSYYEKINENGDVCSKIIKSPNVVSYKYLLNGDCIGNLTGMYDTRKVGKVFQKEIHAEDYLMWLEILRKGYIAINTNTVEAQYRITSASTSANKIKSALWNWNIYKKELKLNFILALFHFFKYSIKGIIKYLK